MRLRNVAGWADRVGGNGAGGGGRGQCKVSHGDEVASTVLDWAVLAHKKRAERRSQL